MDAALTRFSTATAQWFARCVGTPTLVQREAWPVIAGGESVLISAPTGTGKTLSAFLLYLDQLLAQAKRNELSESLYVIYISPLKALGNDIRENLRKPLEGIPEAEGQVRVAIRTGDTPNAERQHMAKHPPHILITTPESLYLLLTSRSGRDMLKTARSVIVDELHALMGTKRGAHLMLSLSRLDALCGRRLQRVGLSATVEPLDVAAAYLGWPMPARIVAPPMRKNAVMAVNGITLESGSIWPTLGRTVYDHCQGMRTVIVFVEGRAQAERVAYQVNLCASELEKDRPADIPFARTHHGSISKEQRLEAEQQLRSGQLRVLCATSSMELGIDVGEVDLVLQIGTPITIASAMQRLGRAGHNPGRTSVMHIFPRMQSESLSCGLTAQVAMSGGIEHIKPPRLCLDVLAQHFVSMAAAEPYTVEEAVMIARDTYCFRQVDAEMARSVLRMLAGDFEHALDRPARPRVLYDRIHDTVQGDTYSRMLSTSSGGTIPDRGLYVARTAEGTRLGELDEEYVFEARLGDKFLLGAFGWRILSIQRESVIVAPDTTDGAQSPFWKGDGVGRSYRTAKAFGALLRGLEEAHDAHRLPQALQNLYMDPAAIRDASDYIARQREFTGSLPNDRTILIEHYTEPSGAEQMMVHGIFGRPVNFGIALLLEQQARALTHMDIRCFDDDDGFLVYPYGSSASIPNGLLQRVRPETARPLLTALLPGTPLFAMVFRYNAARALMMGARSGRRVPLWVQRLRGAQALDDAVVHTDHPLFAETLRECLEDYLDIDAIEEVLTRVLQGDIEVRELRLDAPSPMSLPLRRAAEGEFMYDYSPRGQAVQTHVQQALSATDLLRPSTAQLEQVAARRKQPQDIQQLHALLMAEGDLVAGEIDAPVAWLEALAAQERALYIEPGLWICAEQTALYAAALGTELPATHAMRNEETPSRFEARKRIVRRALRYRGPQDVDSISERYLWSQDDAQAVLDALLGEEIAILDTGLFYHADLYSRAQRETVMQRRKQARTLPPAGYAALLAQRLRPGVEPAAQLRQGVESLLDQPYPLPQWEGALLPARVSGYRPAMLDALLQEGALRWHMTPGDKPLLSFHRVEDSDWNAPPFAQDVPLEGDEATLATALAQRGASFAHALSSLLGTRSPVPALHALMARGLIHADSFLPVRQWLRDNQAAAQAAKMRAHARAQATSTGRWELSRPLRAQDAETLVSRAFDRAVLLCRETVEGMPWSQALDVLRIWEYTGQVRRGYFIAGLSGAQFLRADTYETVLQQLESPADALFWLPASDPAQAWGKSLPHAEGCAFSRVPSTAVALRAGIPVALMERNGQALRVLVPEHLPQSLAAFARDFQSGRVFPGREQVTLKEYPADAVPLLVEVGFVRVMLDYTLWRKRG